MPPQFVVTLISKKEFGHELILTGTNESVTMFPTLTPVTGVEVDVKLLPVVLYI